MRVIGRDRERAAAGEREGDGGAGFHDAGGTGVAAPRQLAEHTVDGAGET